MFWRIVGILGAGYLIAGLAQPKLRNFKPVEFGIFYPLIDSNLLTMLDDLRDQWGRPIFISPVEGAIGRVDDSSSQHNIIYNLGVSRAVDMFPTGSSGTSMTPAEAEEFANLARSIGFTGIGVYRDTVYKNEPWIMGHLDTRINVAQGETATWSRIDGDYQAITEAYS